MRKDAAFAASRFLRVSNGYTVMGFSTLVDTGFTAVAIENLGCLY